ncbi:MAG: hypothetical protein M1819_001555 [Sarea resinae]|nr:MAG: hypothetical protein M1819_001555 [Sarea resinae]
MSVDHSVQTGAGEISSSPARDADADADTAYEEEHVHRVYEQIASHFSSTRYKPWPIVERFLKELHPGSIGLDIGCGNGKYMAVNPNIFIIGSDRSTNLTKIASQHQPHAAIVADNLFLPHPMFLFDFAISIAVIHHLSTSKRRIQAIQEILKALRSPSVHKLGADENNEAKEPEGRALIYVWALEQKSSRRGWDEGHEQDVMVPWVMKGKGDAGRPEDAKKGRRARIDKKQPGLGDESIKEDTKETENHPTEQSRTFLRYYHLYRSGELEQDIVAAGGAIVESGYEKDNWWAIAIRKPPS